MRMGEYMDQMDNAGMKEDQRRLWRCARRRGDRIWEEGEHGQAGVFIVPAQLPGEAEVVKMMDDCVEKLEEGLLEGAGAMPHSMPTSISFRAFRMT
jgi:hypothetical protein